MDIDKGEKRKRLKQLTHFHNGLFKYKKLVLTQKALAQKRLILPRKQQTELQTLCSALAREYGRLKAKIEEYGGPIEVLLEGGKYKCEAFTLAFSHTGLSPEAFNVVMDTAIGAVNIATGNLQSLTPPETGQIQAPEDSAEVVKYLFDKMQFHPKVVEVSKRLFDDGHYAQAILDAFKAVNNFVKERVGLSLDGKQLMAQVFNETSPIIRLNELRTTSEKNEQEGFKFLFMGAMVGVRNPKAHNNVVQEDPYRTLEYLGFASLLMKRIEEGDVKRPRKKRAKYLKS